MILPRAEPLSDTFDRNSGLGAKHWLYLCREILTVSVVAASFPKHHA